MTNRRLFHMTMARQNGEKLLHFEQAFNVPTLTWYAQGLPRHVSNTPSMWPELTEGENLYDHFNVTGWMFCRFEQFCVPAFEEKVLSVKDGRRTVINRHGNTLQCIDDAVYQRADGSRMGSPPHEIAYAIASRADYEAHRFRYVGNADARVDWAWLRDNAEAYAAQQDYITALWVHGPFAFLRELVGTENAMVLPLLEPDLTRRILTDHLVTCMEAAPAVIQAVRPDCSFIWEDCCGSSGPFISPLNFEEGFGWWYREWKAFLVSQGVPWTVLDTDGNPGPLVQPWYESGIDCIHPWEVNGADMLDYARRYPDYVMMGGIYKHMFEPGDIAQVGRFKTTNVFEAIDSELERVLPPMIRRGGYFPSLDHAANPSTTYPAYRHYCDRLARDYGKANRVTRVFAAPAGEEAL